MTFTINAENNITAHPAPDHAEAAVGAGAQAFSSQEQLAELAAAWQAERLVEIWNSLAGVKPVKSFKSAKVAASRIWERIQSLGEAAKPAADVAEAEKPKAARKAKGRAQAAKGAPKKPKMIKRATPARNAPKGTKAAKVQEASGPREGSKTAQVMAMLQRKGGATIGEIMEKMAWQRHPVRGFMAGAMKKAGYAVESFKPEGGERTYRIATKQHHLDPSARPAPAAAGFLSSWAYGRGRRRLTVRANRAIHGWLCKSKPNSCACSRPRALATRSADGISAASYSW